MQAVCRIREVFRLWFLNSKYWWTWNYHLLCPSTIAGSTPLNLASQVFPYFLLTNWTSAVNINCVLQKWAIFITVLVAPFLSSTQCHQTSLILPIIWLGSHLHTQPFLNCNILNREAGSVALCLYVWCCSYPFSDFLKLPSSAVLEGASVNPGVVCGWMGNGLDFTSRDRELCPKCDRKSRWSKSKPNPNKC